MNVAEQAGITMIQVVVAALILVIGLLGLVSMLVVAARAGGMNRVRQEESSLAREIEEDARGLSYSQLASSGLPAVLQPKITGATLSGSTLTVARAPYTFSVTLTSCSLDDPSDGYGNHGSVPASGGSWCPDVAANGASDSNPDDMKRLSIAVSPASGSTQPQVQQTILIYARAVNGPAVTCVSTTGSCPGSNTTITTGSSQTFNVTSSAGTAAVQWLVNGSAPAASQIPSGSDDPFVASGTSSQFTWNFPTGDGTYTIGVRSFDSSGAAGTASSLQLSLNRHQAIPPATVNAGWNSQIHGVDLQWVPSVDRDILYYRVYSQQGSGNAKVVANCSAVSGTVCTDLTAASPGNPPTCQNPPQSYSSTDLYWVVGVDNDPASGQPRESTSLSQKVDANACDHPPNAPTGLSAALANGTMTLHWTAASPADPDSGDSVQAWRIYRWSGGSAQFPGSRLDYVGSVDSSGQPVTSYVDNAPDPGGAPQSYCVTAVDTHMNESPCSNTATG